jgi:hypothetical protein
MNRFAVGLCLALVSCTGAPVREGTLPDGATFQDYSRQPYGYLRVTTFPDGHKETRDLHTEANFEKLHAGMTPAEVEGVVGVATVGKARYGNGTSSWTYRYWDGVYKVLHVTFGPDGRAVRYDTEWDPNIYSKPSGKR